MPRLIDADMLIGWIRNACCTNCDNGDGCITCRLYDVLLEVQDAPTIDVEQITRCKDCKWNEGSSHNPMCEKYYDVPSISGWFCADGEKR